MTTIDYILEHCRNLVSQPGYRAKYLRAAQANSTGIVGYFSNYVPAEIIAAAGFHPLRLIGRFGPACGPRLHDPICSFVQDLYAARCEAVLEQLKGVVFPNSCDSLKVLRQAWQTGLKGLHVWTLDHPVNTDEPALIYLSSCLRRLASQLSGGGDSSVFDERLREAVSDYNGIRAMLRQLYDKLKNEQLRYSDLLTVMTAGLMMDQNDFIRSLRDFTNLQSPTLCPGKRIMLAGPLTDDLELVTELEKRGASIISDDITNGWRYCSRDVASEGDLYRNIARHVLSQASPTAYAFHQPSLAARAVELGACGVIFINQKRCEPHVHHFMSLSGELGERNIRSLLIEAEHGQPGLKERDVTRIESFLELL